MAITLIFKNTAGFKFITVADNTEFKFDAITSEDHTYENEITDHPIEDGSEISDNVIIRPKRLSIRGVITDTPVRYLSGVRDLLDGQFGGSRSKSAFNLLRDMRDNLSILSVVTSLDIYDDMLITRLHFPKGRSTGLSINVEIELKHITLVKLKTVNVEDDNLATDSKDKAQSTKNLSNQATQQVSGATAKSSSVLFDVFKNIGLL